VGCLKDFSFFVTKLFVPGWGGSPRTKTSKKVSLSLSDYFTAISSSSAKTVADKHVHAAYHNKHCDEPVRGINIVDLRRPWTFKIMGFGKFFALSGCDTHFKTATKWPKIDQDNLHMKFSALNVDFISASFDSLGSRKFAQVNFKKWYPLKWLFYCYWLLLFAIFFAAVHRSRVNYAEVTRDRLGQPAYMKFFRLERTFLTIWVSTS